MDWLILEKGTGWSGTLSMSSGNDTGLDIAKWSISCSKIIGFGCKGTMGNC